MAVLALTPLESVYSDSKQRYSPAWHRVLLQRQTHDVTGVIDDATMPRRHDDVMTSGRAIVDGRGNDEAKRDGHTRYSTPRENAHKPERALR